MTMVKIENISHNPLRDFELYPISLEQVDKLLDSLEKSGMWAGLPARETSEGQYEIAAGHHRLEALRKSGVEEVELIVADYSDEDMAGIMVRENMTQRGGSNFGAQIEAVAAVAKNLATTIMEEPLPEKPKTDDAELIKLWESAKRSIETSKGNILKGKGVGRDAIVKALEGSVTSYTVGQAMKVLKETGQYARVLKGIIPAKDLKLYKASDAKLGRAYTAIASFDKASLGIAFLNAVKAAEGKTAKQYNTIVSGIKAKAEKEGKSVSSAAFAEHLPKVDTSGDNGGGNELTDREKQEQAEMKLKDMGIKFANALEAFGKEFPKEEHKLINDFEWPDQLSKYFRAFQSYEIEEEEPETTDAAETGAENTESTEEVTL